MIEDEDPYGLDDPDPEMHFDAIERTRKTEIAKNKDDWHVQRQKDLVRSRKVSFERVFRDGNASVDDCKLVMDVLGRFCRAKKSTFNPDARLHAMLEGRREVWLEIHDYVELDVDALFNKLA